MEVEARLIPGRAHRGGSPAAGILMALQAPTFAVAAVIHFGTGFGQAAIPETVIAVVLGAGSAAVLPELCR